MGRDGVCPVETSKVGSLLLIPTLDVCTGYTPSRPMTCTSGCYYSLCTPDDGRGERPKHVFLQLLINNTAKIASSCFLI